MKKDTALLKLFGAFLAIATLSACGIGGFWMNGDPSAGKNVKPYGAHWIKAGTSQQEWRRDWVGCGGFSNGNYGTDIPPRSPSKISFEADKMKRQTLAACMRDHGYTFAPGPDFREP